MNYRPVEERHRILTALEKLWERYPSRPLVSLLQELTEGEIIEDTTLIRRINKKL